jgi:hypothetical protein
MAFGLEPLRAKPTLTVPATELRQQVAPFVLHLADPNRLTMEARDRPKLSKVESVSSLNRLAPYLHQVAIDGCERVGPS